MARLYLFAEGQTEQTFADNVLKPHLANFGVYMHPPVLIAHSRSRGKAHRGGGSKYLPMRNDIHRFLLQERGADVYFTTMIDLYALPTEFPSRVLARRLQAFPYKQVKALEDSFFDDVGDSRFVPYIQLHEFEAYLFSDPSWFEYFYDNRHGIAALQAIADKSRSPELIDDGPQTAPSKRITAELPDYEGAKTVVGPQVAELIGLNVIRTKCTHFAEWLTKLEQLDQVHSMAT